MPPPSTHLHVSNVEGLGGNMDCCPYCLSQVIRRHNASTGAEVAYCPYHGQLPVQILVKSR